MSTGTTAAPAGVARRSPPAKPIDDNHTTVGRHAAIDLDSAGNGVAVWQSNGVIYGSRRPAGGTWTAPPALTSTYISATDVVALRENGTAYFDVGTQAPDGEAIVAWARNGAVHATGVSGEYANGKVAAHLDGDLVAYTESAAGATTYYFAAGGTDPVADGWTSATTMQSFGSSVVAFGAGHTYYVAYPPDGTGTDRRFRVSLIDGRTGTQRLVLRRRLCPPGPHPHLRGYGFAAERSGAGVLAWRCTGRTVDVIDVQRIGRRQRLGRIVQIARSRAQDVTDRLSRRLTAFAAGSPTVPFSRAVSAARRDLLAISPAPSGRWPRPSVKAKDVAARSAAATAGSAGRSGLPAGYRGAPSLIRYSCSRGRRSSISGRSPETEPRWSSGSLRTVGSRRGPPAAESAFGP